MHLRLLLSSKNIWCNYTYRGYDLPAGRVGHHADLPVGRPGVLCEPGHGRPHAQHQPQVRHTFSTYSNIFQYILEGYQHRYSLKTEINHRHLFGYARPVRSAHPSILYNSLYLWVFVDHSACEHPFFWDHLMKTGRCTTLSPPSQLCCASFQWYIREKSQRIIRECFSV